jgi:rubrerythrin
VQPRTLTAQDKTNIQVNLSYSWACKDYVKYQWFAEKLKQLGYPDAADLMISISQQKYQRAIKDLEYLLPRQDPAFMGSDKSLSGLVKMPVNDHRDMIISALHSELDQSMYLYREVARKVQDCDDAFAATFAESSAIAKQNISSLTNVLRQR